MTATRISADMIPKPMKVEGVPRERHREEALRDARERTLLLTADLPDEAWLGPRPPIVHLFMWEVAVSATSKSIGSCDAGAARRR